MRESVYNIRMKKKTLLLLLVVLLLVGVYVYRNYIAPEAGTNGALTALAPDAPAQTAALTILEEDGEAADDGEDAYTAPEEGDGAEDAQALAAPDIDERGVYTSRDDVALYIHTYGRLPDNFITKKEAESLGWEGGGLDDYAYGKCIGGSHFGNYEGVLPERQGRRYTECDIDTLHRSSRGAKRIVFSNDGLIYYTDDHYESFTLLYGEE